MNIYPYFNSKDVAEYLEKGKMDLSKFANLYHKIRLEGYVEKAGRYRY